MSKKSRRRFSLEFKSKIILFYSALQLNDDNSEKSINHIARISSIDRRVISPLIKKYSDKILESRNKRNLFKVFKNKEKCICPTMEIELKNWIVNLRSNGSCVSGSIIQKKAIEFYNKEHPSEVIQDLILKCALPRTDFKASRGWLYNFCKRRDLVLRRVSSTGRDLPNNCIASISNFYRMITTVIDEYSFVQAQIINMDETACYLDSPSNLIYSIHCLFFFKYNLNFRFIYILT